MLSLGVLILSYDCIKTHTHTQMHRSCSASFIVAHVFEDGQQWGQIPARTMVHGWRHKQHAAVNTNSCCQAFHATIMSRGDVLLFRAAQEVHANERSVKGRTHLPCQITDVFVFLSIQNAFPEHISVLLIRKAGN